MCSILTNIFNILLLLFLILVLIQGIFHTSQEVLQRLHVRFRQNYPIVGPVSNSLFLRLEM